MEKNVRVLPKSTPVGVDKDSFISKLLSDKRFIKDFAPRFASKTLKEKYDFCDYISQSRMPRTYCPPCKLKTYELNLGLCNCEEKAALERRLSEAYVKALAPISPLVAPVATAIKKVRTEMVFGECDQRTPDLKTTVEVVSAVVEDQTGQQLVITAPVISYLPPKMDETLKMTPVEVEKIAECDEIVEMNMDVVVENIIDKVKEEFQMVPPESSKGCIRELVHVTPDPVVEKHGLMNVMNDWWNGLKKIITNPEFAVFNLYTFKDWLHGHPGIKREKMKRDGDVWKYIYDAREYVIDYGDIYTSFNKACHLALACKKSDDVGFFIMPYDADYHDFALLLLLFFHVQQMIPGNPFTQRDRMLMLPGLDRLFRKNEEFAKKMRLATANITIGKADLDLLTSCPGIGTYIYMFSHVNVKRNDICSVLSTIGVHRDWLRSRMILALQDDFVIPGYLKLLV